MASSAPLLKHGDAIVEARRARTRLRRNLWAEDAGLGKRPRGLHRGRSLVVVRQAHVQPFMDVVLHRVADAQPSVTLLVGPAGLRVCQTPAEPWARSPCGLYTEYSHNQRLVLFDVTYLPVAGV